MVDIRQNNIVPIINKIIFLLFSLLTFLEFSFKEKDKLTILFSKGVNIEKTNMNIAK